MVDNLRWISINNSFSDKYGDIGVRDGGWVLQPPPPPPPPYFSSGHIRAKTSNIPGGGGILDFRASDTNIRVKLLFSFANARHVDYTHVVVCG